MCRISTIGIVGTRTRDSINDFLIVKRKFELIYYPGDKICSGLCRSGADWFAVLIALGRSYIWDKNVRQTIYNLALENKLRYKIPPIWFPADWEKHKKAAGFVRNTDIAKTTNVLIASVSKDRTGGTEDTVKKFIKFHGTKNLHIV